jgi:glycosyltransferase involved in cell wall biosynthesis
MALSNKSGLNLYLSATTDIYEDIYRFGNSNLDNELESLINKVNNSHNSNLSKCLILDSKLILPNDLLKKMDIATMSNSLEARSPFLSKYMLEWAPKLPDKAKINGLQTKFILRKLANKYSLNEISKQPKRGFEVPLKNWVENDLKENIYDVLNDSGAYCNSFVSRSFISRLLNNPKSFPSEKRAKILWNLFSLEVWHNSLNRKNKQIVNVGSFKDTIKKNNILYLTTGLGLGGAERVVFDLCKNINKIKYDVTVIGISEQKNMLSAFHNNKINAYCLNYKKTIAKFLTSVKEVKMHIDNHDINIIHAHMFHTLIIACLMKIMKRKIFVIFTPHNSFYSMKFRKIILFILKPFRDADTVFSESAVKFFHKSTPALIPNGISMDDYAMIKQNNNEKKFTFIVIGRLEFMKNHEFLINLISQLSDFNFELKIVGSGMLESKLKSKVSELNLDEKIHFLGSRKDIPELLSQADCLLLPSLWEAFPIVLLEAAASYVPVITTPVGSIPSFINNDNGYLVNLPDFKEAMIEVMDNYMHAKAKSILLHKKVVKEFQIEKIVKKYENLYDRVLQ